MKERITKRWGLTASLVLYVFLTMIASMILAAVLVILLSRTGLIDFVLTWECDFAPFNSLIVMFALSIVLGAAIAAFFSRKALRPLRDIIKATNEVASGNFNVTVESKGIQELEELSHSFNRMTKELSSIEALRSDFISNFSHEFKTPIVSIRGFAKLLREGGVSDADKDEYLEIIFAESERLANLSTNILNLSKYEAIEIITEKTDFRLDEQVRRAILLSEQKWAEKNINIDIRMDNATFFGDADLTQQIWVNLLDNAIKFTKPEGNIGITLIDLPASISLAIQDDGMGMDKETQTRIFDKFYQEDKSHTQDGNGLGLPMAKRIAQLHGGTIKADSTPGSGSVFTVVLPKSR
jgi:signal transduction histidine kinase